ncbi:MAG: VanZ family protein [Bacteroidetes bacterium]|nr:VanZ family protein [Bacteroidota bacterium]
MKVNRAILPAVLWTLFIASSCLLPASAFKKFTFDSLSQLDKLIHLILYVVFVMLWALSLKRVLTIKEKLVLLLVSVAYGVLIEVLQSAMALGRAYDIDDIIANTVGCFLGILLMSFIARKMPLLKNRLPFLR